MIRAGRREEANAALEQAERISAETDEQSHAGELLRLRGLLWSEEGRTEEAIDRLSRALEWAKLRAARDLARLLLPLPAREPKSREALASIDTKFPAGPVVPDLQEARELLLRR